MCIATVILILVVIIVLFCLTGIIFGRYERSKTVKCVSTKRLDGKTVLVTGASSGIGFEIAKDLARRGAKVIITSDRIEEGNNARSSIKAATFNEQIYFQHLDFSSLRSVREFSAKILQTEDRLDILINNAGVLIPDVITKDGMNFIMQVNYFGPYLLTLLLLPLLKKTGTRFNPSRIVNTSSRAHAIGTINFDKINSVGQYRSVFSIYCNSKLCVAMFTRELAKRLEGSTVVVNTSDPNMANTNIAKDWHMIFSILRHLWGPHFPSARHAAQTALHVALDEKAGEVSGKYFHNCKMVNAGKKVYDTETSAKLWDLSLKLVKFEDDKYKEIFLKTDK